MYKRQVRAIVEAEVIGWEYQGNDLNMINRYTIYGGHRDMKVDVLFDRPLKQEVFAAGVQILKEGGHMSDHKEMCIRDRLSWLFTWWSESNFTKISLCDASSSIHSFNSSNSCSLS